MHGFKGPRHPRHRTQLHHYRSGVHHGMMMQVIASTQSERTPADGKKECMQGRPERATRTIMCRTSTGRGARRTGTCVGSIVPRGVRPREWEMSGWKSKIVNVLLQKGYDTNVCEPSLVSTFAQKKRRIWRARRHPCLYFFLLEVSCWKVDDILMGGPGLAHHLSVQRLRGKIKFGKWHRLMQDGASFFGGRHVAQGTDWGFRVDMTRFIKERLSAIRLQRGRCLDRSEPATEGIISALRAVSGSLSWLARQCRPDEARTAATLQGSVSRATRERFVRRESI